MDGWDCQQENQPYDSFHHCAIYTDPIGSCGQAPVNIYFEALLETGVDEMTWNDLGDDNVSPVTLPDCHTGTCFNACFRVPMPLLRSLLSQARPPSLHRCSYRCPAMFYFRSGICSATVRRNESFLSFFHEVFLNVDPSCPLP